jgi:hypothetical protein
MKFVAGIPSFENPEANNGNSGADGFACCHPVDKSTSSYRLEAGFFSAVKKTFLIG